MGFCFAMIPMAPLGGRQVWAVVAMISSFILDTRYLRHRLRGHKLVIGYS